jgi:hypothetical protein
VTVPVEECCADCLQRFPAAQAAQQAYGDYCAERLNDGLQWLQGK